MCFCFVKAVLGLGFADWSEIPTFLAVPVWRLYLLASKVLLDYLQPLITYPIPSAHRCHQDFLIHLTKDLR